MATKEKRRTRYDNRLKQLEKARQTWEPQWKDISEQMVPYRSQFHDHLQNDGRKRETKIINNTPVLALDTLSSGMMAGLTSPARKWWTFTIPDKDLLELDVVRVYLDDIHRLIAKYLESHGFYRALANGTYLDLGSIGTSALMQEERPGARMAFISPPIGQYYLDTDDDGNVDVFYWKFQMTVRRMVRKFGLKNCSRRVRDAHRDGNINQTFKVCRAIEPNDEYDETKLDARFKRYKSVWWEISSDEDKFLRESGYDEFPVHCPRWFVSGDDVYGRGPGWSIRGDCRSLQHKEKQLSTLVDKISNPPMKARGLVKRASMLPGDITHLPRSADAMIEPMYAVNPQAVMVLKDHIQRDEERINEGMYAHLWNFLINDERNERPTATEVEARRQEIMLQLGPLLENLDEELLEPIIDRTFNIMSKNGLLPDPPEELEGQNIKPQFISIMHQMQQQTGLLAIRSLVGETANLAQLQPDVLDKLNGDAIVDEVAVISGVRPDSIRSDEEVARMRAERQAAAQAAQDGEALAQGAQAIGDLSGVEPSNLQELAGMLVPAAAAQGGQ